MADIWTKPARGRPELAPSQIDSVTGRTRVDVTKKAKRIIDAMTRR